MNVGWLILFLSKSCTFIVTQIDPKMYTFFFRKGRHHSLATKIRHSKQSAIKMHLCVRVYILHEIVVASNPRAFTFKVIPMCTFTKYTVRSNPICCMEIFLHANLHLKTNAMHLIQFLPTYLAAPNMCEPEMQLANVRETRSSCSL